MKELIELAEKIQDKELRKKVIDYIKNPTPSHKDFQKYPVEKIDKVHTPFSVGNLGTAMRDVLKHTISVTEVCIQTADSLQKNFGLKVNKDYLIAGAVLHDVMKVVEWKMQASGPKHTGVLLDHSMLGVAELYRRDFPEQVIHIVASHFGEGGTTPPRSYEALIVHYVDAMLSLAEFQISAGNQQAQLPILVLDEETMKKLGEKSEE